MSLLSIKTQGIKGGTAHYKENIGFTTAFINDSNVKKLIVVDAFEGHGDTYKQREFCNVRISADGKDLFDGTFDELKNILLNTKKNNHEKAI